MPHTCRSQYPSGSAQSEDSRHSANSRKVIGEVLSDGRVAEGFRTLGNNPGHSRADELKASLAVDIDRPNKVVEDAEIGRFLIAP
jgi:hypothetical protein